MQTLRAAGDLLASAESLDRLAPIAAACGCTGPVSPLDTDTRRAIGLGDAIADANVVAGPGALRALLVAVPAGVSLRELLPRLAGRLAARAPHGLWLVVATQSSPAAVALMAWTDDRRPPRLAALIVDRTHVVDSDAETLRALATVAADRDLLVHSRWVEVLGREALSARFYRALERGLTTLVESSTRGSVETRGELALLNVSRLLFLSFLEAKGWLDGDQAFIAHQFDRCMSERGDFQRRVLRPLFFGTLNTPVRQRAPAAKHFGCVPFLNGGLFARTPLERRHAPIEFSDDAFGNLLATVFTQYRFTAREETSTWSEAAIDPEMLGRAFESLMGSVERRKTGAFYTPFSLVERVANAGLDVVLGECPTREALERFTVLDPACGSGAFLVHVLERVAAARARLGDERDASAIRREVLTRSIYGVDVNPTAVWLCELRLWLSVVIESAESDPSAVLPLPNLDRNIRVGDALAGRAFGPDDLQLRGAGELRRLRQRYANANGTRKDALGRRLDRAERERALSAIDYDLASVGERRRDLLTVHRGRDLFGERYRPTREEVAAGVLLRRRAAALRTLRRSVSGGGALPFSFSVHFADVATRGGFALVLGNPPWVRLHRVAVQDRATYRREFDVARAASWEPGATAAGAGSGFGAQVDVAALFVERSVRLLAPNGVLALLIPVKLWRSLAGGGLRRFLETETDVRRVEDFSDAPSAFDAAVYPSLVVATRVMSKDESTTPCVNVVLHHRGGGTLEWHAAPRELAFDHTPGAPWILLPPDARQAFNLLNDVGRPLAASRLGRPLLGVKCGCNDAFIVRVVATDGDLADVVTRGGEPITIERSMLRPLIRGEHTRRWRTPPSDEWIIWTHDAADTPLAQLPPLARRWLARWRRELTSRADARHRARWWSLFRTESARSDQARVVWADVGREPRASVLAAGDAAVALNTCYVVRCANADDAHTLAALLNTPLARAWLNAAAEPARGGYRRYFGWTLSLLPTPADWRRATRCLGPLVARALDGQPPSDHELLDRALAAYRLHADDVAPLIAWSGHE